MIFVTGATGLLGSHLLPALLMQQQPVKALYRSSVPRFENSDKIEWIKGDILDVPLLEEAMQNAQQVYHCAATVSFLPKHVNELFVTNVEGTANVVNACLQNGVKKLLHVSSVAALGNAKDKGETDENSQWSEATSKSVYAKTKYLAEMEVWRGVGEGLPAVVINPSVILGAHDWKEGSSKIFKTAYDEFPWYAEGATGFVDVQDVVKAMLLLMNSDITAERFIINAENCRYKDVFDSIAEKFKKNKPNRKVSPLLAGLIWRAEATRSFFTGNQPLLTKETAASAQSVRSFSSKKLLTAFPQFRYTPLEETISRICLDFKQKYGLS